VLIYPAYLTDPIESNEVVPLLKTPGRRTPPLFLAVACDDKFTIGTLNLFLELQAAKLPTECHVYSRGGHGGGMEPDSYPSSEWIRPCERWLRDVVSGD
jgi:acetyl esterase/lipase